MQCDFTARIRHYCVARLRNSLAITFDLRLELTNSYRRPHQSRLIQRFPGNKLTDYWRGHDIKQGEEYAILTNIIHQEWSGIGVKDHKKLKSLKSQNLRDHMSEAELIFTALAELSTRQIAETEDATGMDENKSAAKTGGNIAKKARQDLEAKTGKKVVTSNNYLPPDNQQPTGFVDQKDKDDG